MTVHIKIEDAVLSSDGRKVSNKIMIDNEYKHYFKSNEFYVEYDKDVSDVPLGILNIPALSSVIHFAWAVGCDVEIGELDETYLKGLGKAKKIFSSIPAYSFLSFDGILNVIKSTVNTFEKQRKQSLLFSGGLDSTASYLYRKPEMLIMIQGLDIPTTSFDQGRETVFWDRVVKTYEHLPLTLIKSNTMEIYDLKHLFSLAKENTAGYYAAYPYSIITFGLCPPATVGVVDNVMMASTFPFRHYGNPGYPFQNYKPHTIIDNLLGWANVETFDVENDFNRPEKIERFIKPYFEEHGPSIIRVCGHKTYLKNRKDLSKINCGICDKCCRAIAHLSNYGIDPRSCGFELNGKTFIQIKNNIVYRRFNQAREKYFWGELKKHIIEETPYDFQGSKAFLEWLNRYKL